MREDALVAARPSRACWLRSRPRPRRSQDYPNRPIRLIIPFPAGGSNDIVGRAIATQMSERLGKQIVVDNRTGAGGVIGTELASKAPPDGYTILVISIAHSVNPWLYKLPYDPIKAFTPIGIMGTGTNVLTVHPSLPVNSLKELLALAKAKPGELRYASAGVGTFQHLGAELFRLDAKVNLLHVPFRGGGPALVDVLGGHNKIMFSSLVQAVPHIKTGRLRALGTGGKERVPALRRGADDLGGRRARLRGAELVGPARAGRHAARRSSRGCTRRWRRRRTAPEIQEQFEKEGAATRKMSSAGIRQVHRERDEQVGARGKGGRDQGGVTPAQHVGCSLKRSAGAPMARLDDGRNNRDVWAGVMLIATGAAARHHRPQLYLRHLAADGARLFPLRARRHAGAVRPLSRRRGASRSNEKIEGQLVAARADRAAAVARAVRPADGARRLHSGAAGADLRLGARPAASSSSSKSLLLAVGLTAFSVALFIYGLGLPYPLLVGW